MRRVLGAMVCGIISFSIVAIDVYLSFSEWDDSSRIATALIGPIMALIYILLTCLGVFAAAFHLNRWFSPAVSSFLAAITMSLICTYVFSLRGHDTLTYLAYVAASSTAPWFMGSWVALYVAPNK